MTSSNSGNFRQFGECLDRHCRHIGNCIEIVQNTIMWASWNSSFHFSDISLKTVVHVLFNLVPRVVSKQTTRDEIEVENR